MLGQYPCTRLVSFLFIYRLNEVFDGITDESSFYPLKDRLTILSLPIGCRDLPRTSKGNVVKTTGLKSRELSHWSGDDKVVNGLTYRCTVCGSET